MIGLRERYAQAFPRNHTVDGVYRLVTAPLVYAQVLEMSSRIWAQPILEESLNQVSGGIYVGFIHAVGELGHMPPVADLEVLTRLNSYDEFCKSAGDALLQSDLDSYVDMTTLMSCGTYFFLGMGFHKIGNNGRSWLSGWYHSCLAHLGNNIAAAGGNSLAKLAWTGTLLYAWTGRAVSSFYIHALFGISALSWGATEFCGVSSIAPSYTHGMYDGITERSLALDRAFVFDMPQPSGNIVRSLKAICATVHDVVANYAAPAVSSAVRAIVGVARNQWNSLPVVLVRRTVNLTSYVCWPITNTIKHMSLVSKTLLLAGVITTAYVYHRSHGSIVREQVAPRLPPYLFDGLNGIHATCERFGIGCIVNHTDIRPQVFPNYQHRCDIGCGCGRRPLFVCSNEFAAARLPWDIVTDLAVVLKRGDMIGDINTPRWDYNLSLVSSFVDHDLIDDEVVERTYHVYVATPATITRIVHSNQGAISVGHGTFTYDHVSTDYIYDGAFGQQTVPSAFMTKCAAAMANVARDEKYAVSLKSYVTAQMSAHSVRCTDTMAVIEGVAKLSDDYAIRYRRVGVVDPNAGWARQLIQLAAAEYNRCIRAHDFDTLLSNIVLTCKPTRHVLPWKYQKVIIPQYTMWCAPNAALHVAPVLRIEENGFRNGEPFRRVPPPGAGPDDGAEHGPGDQPPEYDNLDFGAGAGTQPAARPDTDRRRRNTPQAQGGGPTTRTPSRASSIQTDADGEPGGVWVDRIVAGQPEPYSRHPPRCHLRPRHIRGHQECCDSLRCPISYILRDYGERPTPTSETPTVAFTWDEHGLCISVPGIGEDVFDSTELHQVFGGYHDVLFYQAAIEAAIALGPPGSRNFEALRHVRDHFIHVAREVRCRNTPIPSGL